MRFRGCNVLTPAAGRLPQVYYVSNGQLKPADRRYSSSTFAYDLTLNETTAVELCTDAAMEVAALHYDFVPFDKLATKLTSKAAIDVVGVVTAVSELSSVARKTDGMQLPRRELTLLDSTARTVRLTLWNSLAEEVGGQLAGMAHPVIAVKAVRVSDYNGVSLSTITRSTVAIEPADVTAAAALRAWYDKEGATVSPTEAGAGLSNALGGTGGAGKTQRRSLASVEAAPLGSSDGKAEWCTLLGCIARIYGDEKSPQDSTLWYPACPTCNKKVVATGSGAWNCESCNSVGACKRRFILKCLLADATAATQVNIFDDQAKQLIGCSADELAEKDEQQFKRYLAGVQWQRVAIKAKITVESYKDKLTRRVGAFTLAKPDYAAESKALLAALAA